MLIIWCKFNQWKEADRIYSQSGSKISWKITCIAQWLPISPRKTFNSSWHVVSYCKKAADEYGIKVGDVKNLIPNLGNKTNYAAHYRNPQWYLSLGMKLTKIHQVLRFKRSDWMKKYIDFNTGERTNAANRFEKKLF